MGVTRKSSLPSTLLILFPVCHASSCCHPSGPSATACGLKWLQAVGQNELSLVRLQLPGPVAQ